MNDGADEESTDMSESARDGAAAHHHHHGGRSSAHLLDQAAILAALEIRPGQTILDAGCGNGYMSKAFAAAVGETGIVHALDPHEEAIATLRSEVVGSNIRAFVGDITVTTPLADASIDLIYLSTVVHGFTSEQMRSFGDEVARLLRPGGRLAIVEIDKRPTPMGPSLELRFSPEELCGRIPLTPRVLVRVGEHFYMQTFEKPA